MSAPLSVVSVNVRGLRGRRKRLNIFNTLKQKFADAVFLFQETHSNKSVYQTWRSDWGSEIFLNHGESNSMGVMLAFSNNLDVCNLNVLRTVRVEYNFVHLNTIIKKCLLEIFIIITLRPNRLKP